MRVDGSKYIFAESTKSRPDAASSTSFTVSLGPKHPPLLISQVIDVKTLKGNILLSLKTDIAAVIKTELKIEDFDFLKQELQTVK